MKKAIFSLRAGDITVRTTVRRFRLGAIEGDRWRKGLGALRTPRRQAHTELSSASAFRNTGSKLPERQATFSIGLPGRSLPPSWRFPQTRLARVGAVLAFPIHSRNEPRVECANLT
jgi:hypothetical protein